MTLKTINGGGSSGGETKEEEEMSGESFLQALESTEKSDQEKHEIKIDRWHECVRGMVQDMNRLGEHIGDPESYWVFDAAYPSDDEDPCRQEVWFALFNALAEAADMLRGLALDQARALHGGHLYRFDEEEISEEQLLLQIRQQQWRLKKAARAARHFKVKRDYEDPPW